MADEDIQPIVCDNGTGMVKVVILNLVFSAKRYVPHSLTDHLPNV